jgi:protein-serine/threonine kinase
VVDEEYNIKIIDFGSVSRIPQKNLFKIGYHDYFFGTLAFASPEIFAGKKYRGSASDVWALGVILYHMVYRKSPFNSAEEVQRGIRFLPYDSEKYDDGCVNLVGSIFETNPRYRPTIEEIRQHSWILMRPHRPLEELGYYYY